MKIFLLIVSSSLYLPMACLANPPIPKAITYDQIEKREHEVTLSTDVDVHASTRISTLSESFFCENQTMKVEVSQRFEERKRISVNMSVEKMAKNSIEMNYQNQLITFKTINFTI